MAEVTLPTPDITASTAGELKTGDIFSGETGSRDENGISTATLRIYAEKWADIFTVGGGGLGMGYYNGLVEVSRTWEAFNNGTHSYIVTVTYRGIATDDPSGGSDNNGTEDSAKFSVDADYDEKEIEQHPKLAELVATYGGFKDKDNQYQFAETMPAAVSSKGGLGGKSLKKGDPNPLYGQKTYPALTVIINRVYAIRKLKGEIFRSVGTVVKYPPNIPDAMKELIDDDRDFLVLPPKIESEGDVTRITERYMMSPKPGGWPPILFETTTFSS